MAARGLRPTRLGGHARLCRKFRYSLEEGPRNVRGDGREHFLFKTSRGNGEIFCQVRCVCAAFAGRFGPLATGFLVPRWTTARLF